MAFAMPRRGAQMLAPLLCLALGLGFLLSGGLLGALGEAGLLPASLAVWSVPLVFATIGAMLLMHYDER
jgi:lipopolysaccharide export system permease protein